MRARKLKPGAPIRVLVVDDSVVIRQLVVHALENNPLFHVVGTAQNGVIAMQQMSALKPDVVTLDVEMPEMNGIQTLREIRKLYPNTVVIMFSTLTSNSAATTLEALALGANDYVAKVANVGSLSESMARLQMELIPKLKQFFIIDEPAAPRPVKQILPATASGSIPRRTFHASARQFHAVAVGVSTGGPPALAEIIPMIPKDFALPVFIVQHMPPLFTKSLAERLHRICALPVHEATQGMPVEGGTIYVAPGDFHMRTNRTGNKIVINLNKEEQENSCRPAVDVLFRSVSETYNGQVIAAVLTGMGRDGERGAEAIRQSGGHVIAQDESSSVVWGMPGAVVNAGLANSVMDLKSIVPEILKRAGGQVRA